MALTLARTDERIPGTRGLSLFYVEIRNNDGALNGIEVRRLKEKLGTRALPTAELELNGTRATMLGDPGNGVRKASALLNITRSYNAICAVGYMRRGIALARDFSTRREAFGRFLSQQPLHLETLADLQTEFEGGLQLSMRLAELLGKEECDTASDSERALLRILTPLAKLSTGKQTVAVCSEVLECFGGAGYVEDTGLPQLLRDAQVLPIWEGTTNILSLDVLRAGEREGALQPFFEDCKRLLTTVESSPVGKHLEDSRVRVTDSLLRLVDHSRQISDLRPDAVQAGARALALGLARTYAGALLLNHAVWSIQHEGDGAVARVEAARRWCRKPLATLLSADKSGLTDTAALALT
jgi:putative acyl-CoA dehydrogenase